MTPYQPNTGFLLLARYNSPVVTLEQIRKDYLSHMNTALTERRAALQQLPFPCFRSDPKSQKSPWMVNVTDVATWLNNAHAAATKDWQAMQAS